MASDESSPKDFPRDHPKNIAGSASSKGLILLLLFMEFLWSLHYVATKIALREFQPLTLAAVRIVAAVVLLEMIYLGSMERKAAKPIPSSSRFLFFQLGLFGIALNQFFFVWGLSKTQVSHSALIIATSPLFVLLIARLRGMERIAYFRILGMFIAVLGVISLNLKRGFQFDNRYLVGDLITTMGVVSFSYYTIIGKSVTSEFGLLKTTLVTYFAGALLLIPAGILNGTEQRWENITWHGIAALVYMVVFGSVVCYLIYFYALRHSDASGVAAYAYLQPLMTSVFSIALLGENLTWNLVIGVFMILTGVIIAERGREVFDWLV